MPTFDTPSSIDLNVRIGMGNLDVVASDRGDTVVEILPRNAKRPGDVTLAREATVRFESGRLVISVPKRFALFGPGDWVDVRVAVPTGSTVTAVNGYGDIHLRGVLGTCEVIASYGATTIDHTGDLKLASPHGEVTVGTVDGNLDLTAGHGRTRVSRVTGDTTAKGTHGDIDFGEVDGDIDVRASAGIAIDRAGGDVAIRTAHGAIRVREVGGGTVRLESGYAAIEVGVPSGTAAWIDAVSQHGIVRNELTAESGPGDAHNTVELRLRSNYGEIAIRRAVLTTH